MDDGAIYLTQTESFDRSFLRLFAVDGASNLRNLQFGHGKYPAYRQRLRFLSEAVFLLASKQVLQTVDRSLDHVIRVTAAEHLGEHVLHT